MKVDCFHEYYVIIQPTLIADIDSTLIGKVITVTNFSQKETERTSVLIIQFVLVRSSENWQLLQLSLSSQPAISRFTNFLWISRF